MESKIKKVRLRSVAKKWLVWLTAFYLAVFTAQLVCAESKSSVENDRTVQRLGIAGSNILDGSKERIELYRKTNAIIQIVTQDGLPVIGAEVFIEQTNHEFLFGCGRNQKILNIIFSKKYGKKIPRKLSRQYSMREKDIDTYLRRFLDFANYTFMRANWAVYEPKHGKINHSLWDREIQWLKENGLKLRAGHLVWNYRTPDWVPERCGEMISAIEKRVRDFISRYIGKIDYFSVVNEATRPFRPSFEKDKMTRCYREVGRDEFVFLALRAARRADPAEKLVINETMHGVKGNKGFAELLKTLKDSHGKPLYDVIGIQSHMHRGLWSLDQVWEICELYAGFGVPIHFTELTVLSGTPMAGKRNSFGMQTTVQGERQQAEYAAMLYTLLFSHPAVESIQWWNLTDLGAYRNAPGGLLRKDMTPKPVYYALMDLIWKKWRTKVKTKTSNQGDCRFKGFYGDYLVTITAESGGPKSFKIKLSKKGERKFNLIL